MENIILQYVDTLYVEGGTRSNRWMSIDIVFMKKNGEYVRHKFFAPDTYRDRRLISGYLRNLFTVLDVNYNDVKYHYEWYSLASTIKNMLADKEGTEIYGKLIVRKEREQLGITLPVLSKEPNLKYSSEEKMFQSDSYDKEKQVQSTVKSKPSIGMSQKDRTKQRLENEKPF